MYYVDGPEPRSLATTVTNSMFGPLKTCVYGVWHETCAKLMRIIITLTSHIYSDNKVFDVFFSPPAELLSSRSRLRVWVN